MTRATYEKLNPSSLYDLLLCLLQLCLVGMLSAFYNHTAKKKKTEVKDARIEIIVVSKYMIRKLNNEAMRQCYLEADILAEFMDIRAHSQNLKVGI